MHTNKHSFLNDQMSTHFILHTLNSLHTELSTHSDHNSKCIHMYTLTHTISKRTRYSTS